MLRTTDYEIIRFGNNLGEKGITGAPKGPTWGNVPEPRCLHLSQVGLRSVCLLGEGGLSGACLAWLPGLERSREGVTKEGWTVPTCLVRGPGGKNCELRGRRPGLSLILSESFALSRVSAAPEKWAPMGGYPFLAPSSGRAEVSSKVNRSNSSVF